MQVGENPGISYNPLFIYGGVGLGKTHLLIAVGHHMYRLNPGIRVKYVTSEQFLTEFIKAVRERQSDRFRQRYREVDVLLVDDSIVRGTTSKKIVEMMRGAGATEVHMRISSPPTTHSCFYGIDTPERKELLASSHSVEEMAKLIGMTALAPVDQMYVSNFKPVPTA